jgi:hypothetical protein
MVRFHLAPPLGPGGRPPGHGAPNGGIHPVLKKLLIIAGVVGGTAYVVKKLKTAKDERALWHEATTSADLR